MIFEVIDENSRIEADDQVTKSRNLSFYGFQPLLGHFGLFRLGVSFNDPFQ